jgi:3-hydroxymyristoyl/3-hydroxydecanoyl-(acyl carrier protein) dehydratase
MTRKVFNQEEITNLIPHRFENILLDEVEVYKEGEIQKGRLKLKIDENDTLNRNVFFKEVAGEKCIIEPVYMEILALSAIIIMSPLAKGITVYFSSINAYKKSKDIKLGEMLVGEIQAVKAKGDFHKFNGVIMNEKGEEIMSGSLMAFAMDENVDMGDAEKKQVEVPVEKMNEIISDDQMAWKSKYMKFADEIVDISEDSIVVKYTYPEAHILTKGHFPGNPVMMGVSQWKTAVEAIGVFVGKQTKLSGNVVVTADVEIVKSDGVVASEVKRCVCSGEAGKGMMPMSVDSVKRVLLRDIVRPNDVLYSVVKNIHIEQ